MGGLYVNDPAVVFVLVDQVSFVGVLPDTHDKGQFDLRRGRLQFFC